MGAYTQSQESTLGKCEDFFRSSSTFRAFEEANGQQRAEEVIKEFFQGWGVRTKQIQ